MKKSFFKRASGLGLLLFSTTLAFSQEKLVNVSWLPDRTIDNVEFFYRIADCDGKKVVALKFNNRNHHSVNVTWNDFFVTQFKGNKAESVSAQKRLKLAPGITAGSACENVRQKELITSPKQASPVYQEEIVQFKFKDIKVFQ